MHALDAAAALAVAERRMEAAAAADADLAAAAGAAWLPGRRPFRPHQPLSLGDDPWFVLRQTLGSL